MSCYNIAVKGKEEKMITSIKCNVSKKGQHDFILNLNGENYYMFSQNYHTGVNKYFKNGVSLNNAMDRKKAKNDHCIIKTMDKFQTYIKYLEKEYDIKILNKTLNKGVINDKKKKLINRDLSYG